MKNENLSKLVYFYEDKFKPLYADAVAYLGDKPINILVELENTLSHLLVYLNNNNEIELRNTNLERAYNHLVRSTLDCAKLIWAKMIEDIEEIWKDDVKRVSTTLSLSEFIQLKQKFYEKGKEARRKELESIGISPLTSLQLYEEAIELGWSIIKNVDLDKELVVNRFKWKFFTKEKFSTFIIGVVSGIIGTVITEFFLK